MKKMLVTGAAGFVGKNLVPMLAAEGIVDKLILVDKHPVLPGLVNQIKTNCLLMRMFKI
jgi:nucleoside-diphosphate-sugar epimerase